jgi:NAD(P) transhydrogenase subunit beta
MIENRLDAAIDISYLVAAVLFILGLKGLSSPATARRGNQLAAVGMAVAVIATMVTPGLENHLLMIVAMAIGAVLSIYAAQTIKMTAMPQMVAIFNGTGGAASALVAVAEFMNRNDLDRGGIVTIVLGTIVGAISFTGSMVAYAKLQELMPGRPVVYPAQQIVNAALGIAIVVLSVMVVLGGDVDLGRALLVGVLVLALVLGALVVLPIGGADMPVVIAIQNSLTGVASVFTGLVLSNQALVVAGLLVGASGVLLSLIMARAMNRSLTNVLFGAFGSVATGAPGPGAPRRARRCRSGR